MVVSKKVAFGEPMEGKESSFPIFLGKRCSVLRIKNVQLPNGKIADIIIEGSKIVAITEPTFCGEGIDGTGFLAIPGVIDCHVHGRFPGGEHKEDWATLSRAALKGGVRTVFLMPNTDPPLTSMKQLEVMRDLIRVNHGLQAKFWFGATADNLAEIEAAIKEPDVVGVKIYMGSTTGSLLVTKDSVLRSIFSICAEEDAVVAVHAENEDLMQINLSSLGRGPLISDHSRIRDIEVEVSAVKRAIHLAEETRCMLYLCHLSTVEAIELALEAKERGVKVFIEVTPHHMLLDQRLLRGEMGGFYKMNPPLRDINQVEGIKSYVCDGSVDVCASDHAAHTWEEKYRRSYKKLLVEFQG